MIPISRIHAAGPFPPAYQHNTARNGDTSVMPYQIIPEDAVRVTIRKDPEQGFDYRKITVKGFRGLAGAEEKAGEA